MALTLREILDKQRAEREAREQKPVASAASTNIQEARPPSPEPPQVPSSTQPVAQGRGLLSRLQGASNVAQSQTLNTTPQIGTETKPTGGNGSAPLPDAEKSIPSPIVSVPAFTEDETETLRKNLAFMAANLDEKEIIGQVLRTTVRQIQAHPELSAIMIDSDFDLIVAAARRSMKYTARRKEEKTDARSKKANQKAELEAFLKDAGIEL